MKTVCSLTGKIKQLALLGKVYLGCHFIELYDNKNQVENCIYLGYSISVSYQLETDDK